MSETPQRSQPLAHVRVQREGASYGPRRGLPPEPNHDGPWSWTAVLRNREISSRRVEATPQDAGGQRLAAALSGTGSASRAQRKRTGPSCGVLSHPTLLAAEKEIISTQEGGDSLNQPTT